jgi:hypothetical protein
VRIIGAVLFLAGAAGASASVARSFADRPWSWAFGLVAPVAVLVALLGALLLFVPDFL